MPPDPQLRLVLDWHTVEKIAWGGGVAVLVALWRFGQPWLAKQLFRLLRENRADYVELSKELNAPAFATLDTAHTNATEALRLVKELEERVEQVESATSEMGDELAGLANIRPVLSQVRDSMENCLTGLRGLELQFARLDERQRVLQPKGLAP